MRYVKTGALALALLLFTTFASLIARARQYHVRIKRDTFGVPHIIGISDANVAFGMGFAHSEDDFITIKQVALAVRGQLAATEGSKAAVTDYQSAFSGSGKRSTRNMKATCRRTRRPCS